VRSLLDGQTTPDGLEERRIFAPPVHFAALKRNSVSKLLKVHPEKWKDG